MAACGSWSGTEPFMQTELNCGGRDPNGDWAQLGLPVPPRPPIRGNHSWRIARLWGTEPDDLWAFMDFKPDFSDPGPVAVLSTRSMNFFPGPPLDPATRAAILPPEAPTEDCSGPFFIIFKRFDSRPPLDYQIPEVVSIVEDGLFIPGTLGIYQMQDKYVYGRPVAPIGLYSREREISGGKRGRRGRETCPSPPLSGACLPQPQTPRALRGRVGPTLHAERWLRCTPYLTSSVEAAIAPQHRARPSRRTPHQKSPTSPDDTTTDAKAPGAP